MPSMSRVRSLLRQVLHLDEPPHRIALAFALGVFLTFSPLYGLHIIMALFCSWAFRLNFVALGAGLSVNNPWTLIPILGLTLWLGCVALGVPFPTALDWSDTSASGIFHQVAPYALPFVIGGLLLSIAGALAAYPIAHYVVTRFRHSPSRPAGDPLPPQPDIR